jgi:uncharacterized protein with HEPN domain
MPREYKAYLEDIVEGSRRIASYTSAMSLKQFASDLRTFDAVVRNLEIVGEAAKQIPEAIRARRPQIEEWALRFSGRS